MTLMELKLMTPINFDLNEVVKDSLFFFFVLIHQPNSSNFYTSFVLDHISS